ncbi:MAG: flavin reductase family protein [Mogibacterium sp.]|nr:flavin reductase family protein [Mogibacterium sp.]
MKINSIPGPLLAPVPSVMVSCGTMEESNILTIAWTGIINSNPPMTYISVQPRRFSHDIIEKSGEFVINLVPSSLAKAMDFCGVKSGRDIDKFEAQGLTREKADTVSAPLIAESPLNIECKVKDIVRLPSHDMFMAEITAVHVDEKYVDEKGAYDYGAMDLVAYNHGKYYRLMPEELGFFGYSVMKPKTAKRKAAEKARRKKR